MLVALYHLDEPWKPTEVEQILRHGKANSEISIYRYVTESSFDAYRAYFGGHDEIHGQVMTGDNTARRADVIG